MHNIDLFSYKCWWWYFFCFIGCLFELTCILDTLLFGETFDLSPKPFKTSGIFTYQHWGFCYWSCHDYYANTFLITKLQQFLWDNWIIKDVNWVILHSLSAIAFIIRVRDIAELLLNSEGVGILYWNILVYHEKLLILLRFVAVGIAHPSEADILDALLTLWFWQCKNFANSIPQSSQSNGNASLSYIDVTSPLAIFVYGRQCHRGDICYRGAFDVARFWLRSNAKAFTLETSNSFGSTFSILSCVTTYHSIICRWGATWPKPT